MELREFVSNVLTQVRQALQDYGEAVFQDDEGDQLFGVDGRQIEEHGSAIAESSLGDVRFDIAVTVSDSSSGTKKAGIAVLGIGAGGEKSKNSIQETVSRIQFTVFSRKGEHRSKE